MILCILIDTPLLLDPLNKQTHSCRDRKQKFVLRFLWQYKEKLPPFSSFVFSLLHVGEMVPNMELSRTLWGSWVQKSFCVPWFLFLRNRFQPLWPSLNFKGQFQTVANQGGEGMQRQGRSSQETIVHPWGRILVPFKGYREQYLWTPSRTPNKWNMLALLIPERTTWGQIKGTRKTPQKTN